MDAFVGLDTGSSRVHRKDVARLGGKMGGAGAIRDGRPRRAPRPHRRYNFPDGLRQLLRRQPASFSTPRAANEPRFSGPPLSLHPRLQVPSFRSGLVWLAPKKKKVKLYENFK